MDSDRTLLSGASDLGLHYLPMSLLWDVRHKWIKMLSKFAEEDILKLILLFFKDNKVFKFFS